MAQQDPHTGVAASGVDLGAYGSVGSECESNAGTFVSQSGSSLLVSPEASLEGNDFSVRMLAAHPNIEVRLFNPLREGRDSSVGRFFGMLAGAGVMMRIAQ